jgi:hypothetical protein
MSDNLAVQGYCLTPAESRRLRWGLRFPTALCFALVLTGLLLQSAVLVLALVPVGAIAGWTKRHPFDLIWNRVIAPLTSAPLLPPNPTPRRNAFKIATAWLLLVGVLFAAGAATAGVVIGAMLLGACAAVTVANFCIPSTLLAIWGRRHEQGAIAS